MPGASFSNTSVGVNQDMTFTVGGLTERQTFRLGIVPEGWFLKSVTHAGTDITDTGYDFKPGERVSGVQILLTRRATTLTGTVQDDRGEPLTDYTVVVFSSRHEQVDVPDEVRSQCQARSGRQVHDPRAAAG